MGKRTQRRNRSSIFAAVAATCIAISLVGYFVVTSIIPSAPASQVGRSRDKSALQVAAEVQAKGQASITAAVPATASPSPTFPAHSSAPTPAPAAPPAAPVSSPITSVPAGNVECDYRDNTWSGDASSVGYSIQDISATNGDLASFAIILNADPGTTEVVGGPDDQCILYSALPSTLTSSFAITPPANSSGLDYEYDYDIWLTTASAATNSNWNNDLELMIWTYVNGQTPLGSVVATLSDGSQVWFSGNNTTGTVSVVLPHNETSATINIANLVSQLKALGYVNSADNGILDIEYGIEAPYGGGKTFEVNGFSVTAG
jgi:Glycosyl hydrolase family 12